MNTAPEPQMMARGLWHVLFFVESYQFVSNKVVKNDTGKST